MPMITRRYPGYQETIYGSEGIIVSKQIITPMKSGYDRSVLWLLECQAEGDRFLRVEIEIDWGEPLDQRIVDGLLVAQANPGRAQGIYQQQNADSTRVFGNPESRPVTYDIDDPQRAHLTYYVLINGIVPVPFVLTISDVGEQVAWNGFLALRDTKYTLQISNREWKKLLDCGRLWTPDPTLNWLVHQGKIAAVYHCQRLRTGYAPNNRQLDHFPRLIDCYDTFDVSQARNLLAHLRRLAERAEGQLPSTMPLHPKATPELPEMRLAENNAIYLTALHAHLHRHFDADLLNAHYKAVQQCVEAVIQKAVMVRAVHPADTTPSSPEQALERDQFLHKTIQCLYHGLSLARLRGDTINQSRWESELAVYQASNDQASNNQTSEDARLLQDETQDGILHPTMDVSDQWQLISLVGDAFWPYINVEAAKTQSDEINIAYPIAWAWWGVLDLPSLVPAPIHTVSDQHEQQPQTTEQKTGQKLESNALSIVWDGGCYHATQSSLSIQSIHHPESSYEICEHAQITAINTDEYEFDLTFVFKDGDSREKEYFKPNFE
ncbi:MAG: hypothetical protein AAF639_42545 [Chloroflexota bacterium]